MARRYGQKQARGYVGDGACVSQFLDLIELICRDECFVRSHNGLPTNGVEVFEYVQNNLKKLQCFPESGMVLTSAGSHGSRSFAVDVNLLIMEILHETNHPTTDGRAVYAKNDQGFQLNRYHLHTQGGFFVVKLVTEKATGNMRLTVQMNESMYIGLDDVYGKELESPFVSYKQDEYFGLLHSVLQRKCGVLHNVGCDDIWQHTARYLPLIKYTQAQGFHTNDGIGDTANLFLGSYMRAMSLLKDAGVEVIDGRDIICTSVDNYEGCPSCDIVQIMFTIETGQYEVRLAYAKLANHVLLQLFATAPP
jgi:hypothetical protein